jgi:hypothetical protein
VLQRDFAFAWAHLTFAPTKAKQWSERVLKIADELATSGVTAGEFQRLREPRRAMAASNGGKNEWWLQQILITAQTVPATLDDVRLEPTVFESLTRDEVNRSAAAHFRLARANVIGAMPGK